MIEQQTMVFLEGVPQPIKKIKEPINEMANIPPKEVNRQELSLEASIKMLESAGILNTPSSSPAFVNISNRFTTIISPVVDKILSRFGVKTVEMPTEVDQGGDDAREKSSLFCRIVVMEITYPDQHFLLESEFQSAPLQNKTVQIETNKNVWEKFFTHEENNLVFCENYFHF